MSIFLREVTIEDGEYIVNWRKSERVIGHLLDKREVTRESNNKFFNDFVMTGRYKQYMVEKEVEGYSACYPLATVYLKNIDNANSRCELGLFPNEKEEWNDITKQYAIKKLLEKAIGEFGMKTVYAYVIEGCDDELALMQSSGFVQEGYLENDMSEKKEKRKVLKLRFMAPSGR